jgi:glycosyltransferase involved in cell wall biosynthesis
MHFGKPVITFDCNFNRSTTEDKAVFFKSSDDLVLLMETVNVGEAERVGSDMVEIANRRYTWRIVAQQYFALLIARSKNT